MSEIGRTGSRFSRARSANCDSIAVVAILLGVFCVPVLTTNIFIYSLANQILIAVIAAFSVFILLRMDLLSFALPAFMALGGYSLAIASKAGITAFPALVIISFVVPALVAVPFGALVLRLKGTYFVLVTFAFNEVMQLLLFEFSAITGGANGIAGVPATTFLGFTLSGNRMLLVVTCIVALLGALATIWVTSRYRREFASISENETLALSLGLVTWRYKMIGLVVSAGVAGLAGFALVNMLLTAHPSSFSTMSGFNYIVYAIVGGRNSILGPLLGAGILTTATQFFSSKGEYSPALYGMLIMVVVMVAKGGITGMSLPKSMRRTRFKRSGKEPCCENDA